MSKHEGSPRGVVPPGLWQQWLSNSAPDGLHHYLASITCFSGQTVHVQAGMQNLHVTGITPVVGSEPAYGPQVAIVQDGAVLQVTPVCRPGDPLVTLDVHSRVTLRQPSEPSGRQPGIEIGNMPLQSATAIDRPVLRVQRLSTTTRLLMDQVTLIGGMSFTEDVERATCSYMSLCRARNEEQRSCVDRKVAKTPNTQRTAPRVFSAFTAALWFTFSGVLRSAPEAQSLQRSAVRACRSGRAGSGALGTGSYQYVALDQSSEVSARPLFQAICWMVMRACCCQASRIGKVPAIHGNEVILIEAAAVVQKRRLLDTPRQTDIVFTASSYDGGELAGRRP